MCAEEPTSLVCGVVLKARLLILLGVLIVLVVPVLVVLVSCFTASSSRRSSDVEEEEEEACGAARFANRWDRCARGTLLEWRWLSLNLMEADGS